jgi:hypothetical protein
MANLTVTKHEYDCYRVGGRKDCPITSGSSNPRYNAGCYQYQDTSKSVGVYVTQEERIAEAKRNAENALNELRTFIRSN